MATMNTKDTGVYILLKDPNAKELVAWLVKADPINTKKSKIKVEDKKVEVLDK